MSMLLVPGRRVATATLSTDVGGVDPRFNAAIGAQFDFSRTDRFFQENVGPTLVASDGDLIGLALEQAQWGGKTLAGELASLSELRGNGATALVGSATAASYNTSTGAGSVSRGADINNQSYVAWTGLVGNGLYAISVTNGSVATFIRSGTFSGTTQVALTAGQSGTFYVQASVGGQITFTASANSATSTFTVTSIKYLPGSQASQANSSYRAKKYAGWARFDGVDDNEPNGKKLGAAGLVLKRVKLIATTAATQVMMGVVGAGGTDRFYDAFDTSGQLTGRIGSGAAMTITGDLTGTDIVVGLGFDGTTATLLTVTSAGVMTKQTQSQSGAPNTSLAPNLGGYNNNGTYGSPANFDLRELAWFDAMPTDAEIASYARWMFQQ